MDFGLLSVVLSAARFGYRRYGIKGALLFGGVVAGVYLLVKRQFRDE